MPQITILAVGPEKQSQFGAYFGIKVGDEWLNVSGTRNDALKGQTWDANIKASGKFKWAKLLKLITTSNGPQASAGATVHSWWDYARMAKLAHELAQELEPDEAGSESHFEDRSTARAAIVNTVMIAYSKGRVALPKEDEGDGQPPPDDDTIPF